MNIPLAPISDAFCLRSTIRGLTGSLVEPSVETIPSSSYSSGLRKYKLTGQYDIGGSFSVLGPPLPKAFLINQTNRPELMARAQYQGIGEYGTWRITIHVSAKRTKPTVGKITELITERINAGYYLFVSILIIGHTRETRTNGSTRYSGPHGCGTKLPIATQAVKITNTTADHKIMDLISNSSQRKSLTDCL